MILAEMNQLYRNEFSAKFPLAGWLNSANHENRKALDVDQWLAGIKDKNQTIESALSEQLGGFWTGFDNQSDVRWSVLNILGAWAAGWSDVETIADLNQWALAVENGGEFDIRNMIPIETVEKATSVIEDTQKNHAWNNTVTMAIIEKSKARSQVLPSAYFLWLQKYDWILWLMINGAGREECAVEISGISTHYQAEKILEQPLHTPELDHILSILSA